MSAPSFFRKAALEKLSTPDKLDELIQITNPRSWIALCTIGLAIAALVSWGYLGRVKTKVNSAGILLGGEVYDIVSTASGQLLELHVVTGDTVEKGEIVAIIQQPELLQQIERSKSRLEELYFELKQTNVYGSKDSEIQEQLIEQQRHSIDQQIETEKANIEFLKSQHLTEEGLLAKGLITKPQVVGTKQQIEAAENRIETLKSQLVQLTSKELNVGYDVEKRTTLMHQRIKQEKIQLDQLKDQYDLKTKITSPHSGEVVEVLSNTGIVVNIGRPLFKIKNEDTENGKIVGKLYVPTQEGKKIKVGMDAFVVPSTVKPQEHGYMKARVTYVSEFPMTQQGLMTSMKNDQLVSAMLSLGSPYEVLVEFEPNSSNYSGYNWTSTGGPEVLVNAGTSCAGKITVKEEAPIAMVIPAFKDFFDLH